MIPFLKSIAQAYACRFSDLSEFCFLFPNKRSGTFFLKYLSEECGCRLMLAPEIKTISEFVCDLSGLVPASRLDLIFLLYESYLELLGADADGDGPAGVDFDSFRSWGETVLSDFREVDLYLCDPGEIFKNVKDFREIASNFLTEEQRMVMSEYFGREDTGDVSGFWKHFDGDEENLSMVRRKFLHLWRIMAPLYRLLNEKLDSKGLATPGGVYRRALGKLAEEGRGILPYRKVVAVGFNALSSAEREIFKELRDMPPSPGMKEYADFFWDATGPVLGAGINSASRFVKSNMRLFPSPEWAADIVARSDADDFPGKLSIVSSPSNSAQVKIVGTLLGEMRGSLPPDEFRNARVAVVLPDEDLLLPMLYSLPDGMGDVNLTMGYPMRLTSVVPFVSHLRRLLKGMRQTGGEKSFYYQDLKVFLSHPFSHACFGTEPIGKLNGYIDTRHKAMVTYGEIAGFSPEAAEMLCGLGEETTPSGVAHYLDTVLMRVAESLKDNGDALIKSRLEKAHIEIYRDALRRLGEILDTYPVGMRPSTVFRLVDRLLAGEKVSFEGEPLTGLQVMGMLETRSIDFDHIFILSANERVLPMRARTRSFIPDTIRRAFGMPPSNYAEEIFAYYFYRMISRARSVTMIYDARSGAGMRSGDVSRYLLQLRHLFAKERITEEDWKFRLSGKEESDPSVEKNGEIRRRLELFSVPGSGCNLSVSSLSAYRECQVRFFFQSVVGMNTDPAPTSFIGSISAGNILHDMMLSLYLPADLRRRMLDVPVRITSDFIDNILADKVGLKRLLTRTVNRLHFCLEEDKLDTPLEGGALIVGRQIARQCEKILRHDRTLAPFLIHGCEISEPLSVALPSGRKVNFKFAIDRLDEIETGEGRQLRIVDYKTGRIKLDVESIEEVVDGDYTGEQIFQLFTYAWLLDRRGTDGDMPFIRTEIYDANRIQTGEECLPRIGGETVRNYREYAEKFSSLMDGMLEGIFSSPSFLAPAEKERCAMCRLRSLCGR